MADKTAEVKAQQETERARQAEASRQERARAADSEEEPTYTVERLETESYAFVGQPSHVVAGALAAAGTRKKNLTVAELKDLVDEFLNREVESDLPDQG